MPLPTIECLATFGQITSSVSLSLTTAGIARGNGTFMVLSVPPPNIATARNSILYFYTPNRPPYSLATFFVVSSKVALLQTPGFQAAPTFNLINPAVSVTLVSPNILTEGLITPYTYGLQTVLQGPPDGIQIPLNSLGLQTGSIPASGSTTSVVIPSFYYPHIVCGITSTQAGALNIQRYIDPAGTIANGSALTASLTANTAAVIDSVSALGFGSFTVQITNTGTVTANLSGYALLLLAR